MDFVMELDFHDFVRLIAKARHKREEAKAWDMWISMLPHMGKNFKPFSQFFSQQQQPENIPPRRSKEEVLEEAAQIRRRIAAKKKGGKPE